MNSSKLSTVPALNTASLKQLPRPVGHAKRFGLQKAEMVSRARRAAFVANRQGREVCDVRRGIVDAMYLRSPIYGSKEGEDS
jgi:hypothetical protein